MPRDFITPTDVREPTIEIVCDKCGRRGRYSMERLMAEHSNAKQTHADCPIQGDFDACEVAPNVEMRKSSPSVIWITVEPWDSYYNSPVVHH